MKTLKIWVMGLAALAAPALPSWAASVTATLDPGQVALGDSTQLTVTVTGSQEQPTMPTIDGLEIQAIRQGTQISIVNGSMTSSASVTYAITPQHAGDFTIPALQAGDGKSQPLTLHVTAAGAAPAPDPSGAQAQPPTGNGPVVLPQNPPPGQSAPQVSVGKYGAIEVVLPPKKEFYEGELVPVEIKVYIAEDAGAQIQPLPQFTSDGFALNSLGKPEQAETVLNGRPYAVLTWHSGLTAVKTGDYTLNFKLPMSVVVAAPMPSMSDDDAFNNLFRNAIASMSNSRKDIVITKTTEPFKVLPLPQAGRPAGFSGAVGQFDAEASATPTKVNAGDPVTLRLKITGSGNFDRVSTDMLPGDANWKTYSPKSHFDANDSINYGGMKTFDQPVIPNNGSVREIPSLAFSFFDPESRQYVTRTCPPIPIEVSGAAVPVPPPAVASTGNAPADNAPPAVAPAAPDLRMNQIDAGSFVSTLRPLYLNPLFIGGQAIPLLALLGGLAFVRRRREASRPDRARLIAANQAIRRQVEAMDAAMRDGQAGAFFVHARGALQQRLGQEWNMRPEAITVLDLDARGAGGNSNLRAVFEMADQASYSDLHLGDADLKQWRQVVMDELAEAKS
jgi:hypothetical protein